jgi:hypothetical protein
MMNELQVKVTLEQMGRVVRALDGLQQDVGAANPKLFAVMSEAYIDLIGNLRRELEQLLSPSFDQPAIAASALPALPPFMESNSTISHS